MSARQTVFGLSAFVGLSFLIWLASCGEPGLGEQQSAVTRQSAVLLAERTINIEQNVSVVGGDVVVRQIEPWITADGGISTASKVSDGGSAAEPQLVIANNANVGVAADCTSNASTVSATSIVLGNKTCIGNAQTNSLDTKHKGGA